MMAWLPQEDNAVKELHMVVAKVQPAMTDLLQALEMYHLHSADGWITTTGWVGAFFLAPSLLALLFGRSQGGSLSTS